MFMHISLNFFHTHLFQTHKFSKECTEKQSGNRDYIMRHLWPAEPPRHHEAPLLYRPLKNKSRLRGSRFPQSNVYRKSHGVFEWPYITNSVSGQEVKAASRFELHTWVRRDVRSLRRSALAWCFFIIVNYFKGTDNPKLQWKLDGKSV